MLKRRWSSSFSVFKDTQKQGSKRPFFGLVKSFITLAIIVTIGLNLVSKATSKRNTNEGYGGSDNKNIQAGKILGTTDSSMTGSILGLIDDVSDSSLIVRIPTFFRNQVEATRLRVLEDLEIEEDLIVNGGATFQGNLNVGGIIAGNITADNVIYSLTAGDGISVTTDQTPTITNDDKGSSQSIFKKIKTGDDTIEADDNSDTLELVAGSGITFDTDTDNDKITINSSDTIWSTSGSNVYLTTSTNNIGIGTNTPGNKLEIASGTAGTSGLTFTNLTSASTVGSGGGKVLSVDSGGNVILVTDESGGVSEGDLDSALPGGSTGSTVYFDGTTWAHSTNLYHNGGQVGISTTPGTNIRFDVKTNATTSVGLVIRRVSSQTANLLEFRNESDSIVSYFDKDGVFNGSANTSGSLNPGFTTGSVVFQGASGLTQDNANFFWDDVNNRLGIGTVSPESKLDVSYDGINTIFRRQSNQYIKITTDNIGNEINSVSDTTLKSLKISTSGTAPGNISLSPGTGVVAINDVGVINTAALHIVKGNATNYLQVSSSAGSASEGNIFLINGSGNVGIGTTSPGTKLHIESTASNQAIVAGLVATSQRPVLQFSETSGSVSLSSGMSIEYDGRGTGDTNLLNINNIGGSPLVTFQNGGNVGIGTTSPGYILDIASANFGVRSQALEVVDGVAFSNYSSGALASITTKGIDLGLSTVSIAGYGEIESGSAYGISLNIDGDTKMKIDGTTSNVGIGTTSPNSRLTVKGSGTSSSTFGLNITNSSDTSLLRVRDDGRFDIQDTKTSVDPNGYWNIAGKMTLTNAVSSSNVVLAVKGLSVQTGNLQEWQNSSGAVLGAVQPYGAAYFNKGTSDTNLFLGKDSGLSNNVTGTGNQGLYHTFIGTEAGRSSTTGESNTAVGYQALRTATTQNYNTAVGFGALFSNIASSNVAVGYEALKANTSASSNNALGYRALTSNTTGVNNLAIGTSSLGSNVNGDRNIAIGNGALQLNSSGVRNIAVGLNAGLGGAFGGSNLNRNTLLGFETGVNLLTGGDNNILLGYQAGNNLSTGNTNIVLGYDIDAPTATSTQTLNIGNLIFGTGLDGTNSTISTGKIGIGTKTPTNGGLVVVAGVTIGTDSTDNLIDDATNGAGSATLYLGQNTINTTAPSDRRLKDNIVTTNLSLDNILGLEVVDFNYKSSFSNDSTSLHHGLIAQDVISSYSYAVKERSDGYLMVEYEKFVPLLIKGVQEQQLQIDALGGSTIADRLSELETRVLGLETTATSSATPPPSDLDIYLSKSELSTFAKLSINTWQFISNVTFNGKVLFNNRVEFADKDLAGYALISTNSQEVRIDFEQAYGSTPLVQVTPLGSYDAKYWVSDVSTTGFTLKLSSPLAQDASFSWLAVSVKDAKTYGSAQLPSPEPSITPTQSPDSSPSPSPSPDTEPINPSPEATRSGSI
jgi:hypothetical protein